MATRNLDFTIADEISHLDFDQVRARVSAADPQTFYRKAAAFEQAAERLELFGDQLRRYRADLESVWHNGDPRQYEWVDRLLRYTDALIVSIREPGYPAVLRRIGDAVAQSQQRLRGLENHSGGTTPDERARLARDEHARQILGDLSTSYVQSGLSLAEIPERGATGRPIHVPVALAEGSAGHHVMASTSMVAVTGKGRGGGVDHRSVVSALQSPVDGGVPLSAAAEPFGRMSHFATSQPVSARADQPAKFSGFAGMALPAAESAVPPLVSATAAGDGTKKSGTGRSEKTAPLVTSPVKAQATTFLTSAAAPPATVSAELATAAVRATAVAPPVTVAGQPATVVATATAAAAPATVPAAHPGAATVPPVASGAPAALQSTGVSPVISAAAAPTPAVAPPAQPTLPPRPPLPGEFPAMSTSVGASPAPVGDVHGGTASTGAVPPPGAIGAGSMAGGPVSRVDSTWLRADPGTWSGGNGAAARPGLGTGGGSCAPAGVIGHSENEKGEVR